MEKTKYVLNKFGKLNKSNMDCIDEALKEVCLGENVVVECNNRVLAEQAFKKVLYILKVSDTPFVDNKSLLSITISNATLYFSYSDE